MLRKFKMNSKGFTLIELMIVIAIIGVLAAIAIPQFVSYRIRSFNSSAQSDIRNLTTSEAALFADWQMYGGTDAVAQANPLVFNAFANGQGALLYGPTGIQNVVNVVPCIEITAQLANRGLQIPLGNNVELFSETEPAGAASFIGMAKHRNGNIYFGVDGDVTAIYMDEFPGTDGTPLAVGLTPGSSTQVDDFAAQVNGPSGRPWAIR